MGQQRAGMMSRREFIQAVGKGVGALGLLSSAPRRAAAASLLKAPEPNPKRGGTIKTAWGITTSNFDIHQGGTAAILTQMYNNLVRKNPADGLQTIIPELAERWEVTADGLRYTFFLRPDVRFHDGTPLSADDVVATFRRIIFPPEGITSPYKDWFDAVYWRGGTGRPHGAILAARVPPLVAGGIHGAAVCHLLAQVPRRAQQ
jgi:peptide/nickel transport system substrate-binding protein